MNDEEFLKAHRHALRESIKYFSSKNKTERERWVCIELLRNLGEPFVNTEVLSSADEPPDVVFRDAKFEIKEILDDERRRHDEYRAALEKALGATETQALLEQFTPLHITPEQIATRVRTELESLARHYAPSVRVGLDLVFYVNLQDYFLKSGPMPDSTSFASFGWRSICAINDFGTLVFFAAPHAPDFLRSKAAMLTHRKLE